MKRIDCFIAFIDDEQAEPTLANLQRESEVARVNRVPAARLKSTDAVRNIAATATAPFTMIYTKTTALRFGRFALERFLAVAEDSGAALVYADHFNEADGERKFTPVIDYQFGSLRDDFDFGSVLIYRTSALQEAVSRMDEDYDFAGLYDLRLKVSQRGASYTSTNTSIMK